MQLDFNYKNSATRAPARQSILLAQSKGRQILIALLQTTGWQIGQVFSQFAPDDAAALLKAQAKVVDTLRLVSRGPCQPRNSGRMVCNWFVPTPIRAYLGAVTGQAKTSE